LKTAKKMGNTGCSGPGMRHMAIGDGHEAEITAAFGAVYFHGIGEHKVLLRRVGALAGPSAFGAVKRLVVEVGEGEFGVHGWVYQSCKSHLCAAKYKYLELGILGF
jgi:hypothetical protein